MKRRILMVLLGIGAFAGFTSGFASLHRHAHHREAFEAHVADVCTAAARRASSPGAGANAAH